MLQADAENRDTDGVKAEGNWPPWGIRLLPRPIMGSVDSGVF